MIALFQVVMSLAVMLDAGDELNTGSVSVYDEMNPLSLVSCDTFDGIVGLFVKSP